ncbi:hypothetical protein [Parasutterella excrementihominis]|uniref:hypothetical protein n=1 Tax=Parasutterella excrementihominis TaxID=487175 RepID=UPI0024321FA8|nr:hypothetical protein [Parasutterella excrementihominis]
MSTYELTVELDEIQANRLTSLLQERKKLVDGMYEKLESHPKADKKDKTYVQQLLPMDTMIVSIIVSGKSTLTKKSVIGEA